MGTKFSGGASSKSHTWMYRSTCAANQTVPPSSDHGKKPYQDGTDDIRSVLAGAPDQHIYPLKAIRPSGFISQLSLPREPIIDTRQSPTLSHSACSTRAPISARSATLPASCISITTAITTLIVARLRKHNARPVRFHISDQESVALSTAKLQRVPAM